MAVGAVRRRRLGRVGLQTVRDWVLAFNAEGPSGLIDRKTPGNAPLLNDAQRRALARVVEEGPMPAAHGVVRWRLLDLARWVFDECAPSVSANYRRVGVIMLRTARPSRRLKSFAANLVDLLHLNLDKVFISAY